MIAVLLQGKGAAGYQGDGHEAPNFHYEAFFTLISGESNVFGDKKATAQILMVPWQSNNHQRRSMVISTMQGAL